MYKIPAVIFAGGKSSRMGTDKALLPFKSASSLASYQYTKLKAMFNTVYISAKEDKFDFPCEIIYDISKESSPLVAIVSVLENIEDEAVFILSVDAPLVDKKIIDILYQAQERAEDHIDAIIAHSPHGVEPLCAIYRVSILTKARDFLKKNNHKLTHLLDASHIEIVHFSEEKYFVNLNYRKDYATFLGF